MSRKLKFKNSCGPKAVATQESQLNWEVLVHSKWELNAADSQYRSKSSTSKLAQKCAVGEELGQVSVRAKLGPYIFV